MQRFARLCAFAVAFYATGFVTGCGSSSQAGTSGGTTPPVTTAAPVVTSLSPSTAVAGSAAQVLTVNGANFVTGSAITWGGAKRATSYVSSTSLQTDLLATDLAAAATIQVAVADPTDVGGAVSGSLPFLISADTAPNQIPVLTSISPNSAVAGSADITVTLTGSNFIASSTVSLADGVTLVATYQSATSLKTVIPASALVTAGSLAISVVNPAPGGGTSASIGFPITNAATNGQTMISVKANDLAWDPVNQVIYLSLPSADSANGNSIQVLDPSTGVLGKAVFAGSEPDILGVSKSSQYLYAALDGSSAVQRFMLPGLATDINISLGTAPPLASAYYAIDLQPSPVADETFAAVRGTREQVPYEVGGVVIFDEAVQRSNRLCGFAESDCTSSNDPANLYDSIQWSPAADEMYLLDNEDNNFDFYTVPVNAAGLGAVTDYGGLGLAGEQGDRIHYDSTTNLLYRDDGAVIDPATGKKAGQIEASGLAVPDGKNGIIFYLAQTETAFGSGSYTLASFDINDLTPIATLTVTNVASTPAHLVRWGTNGLAFTTNRGNVPGAVYLVSGSFVTSSERQPGSSPE